MLSFIITILISLIFSFNFSSVDSFQAVKFKIKKPENQTIQIIKNPKIDSKKPIFPNIELIPVATRIENIVVTEIQKPAKQNFLIKTTNAKNILETKRQSKFYFNNKLYQIKIQPIKKNIAEYKTNASSIAVLDCNTNAWIYQKNIDEMRPIASITKLVTALVFLDRQLDWQKIYTITKNDKQEGGKIYLFPGDRVSLKSLFNLSLVRSANSATMALVHSTGMSEEEFIKRMNDKAKELKLTKTSFADPIGFSPKNISTVREIVKLAQSAFKKEEILKAIQKKKYKFNTENGKKIEVYNTNQLLQNNDNQEVEVVGGKTGYTNEAGGCFVGEFINENKTKIISVILGGADQNSRFVETQKLVDWVYSNYIWY